MAGKSTHEIKTWVAAFAALSAFTAGAAKAAITDQSRVDCRICSLSAAAQN